MNRRAAIFSAVVGGVVGLVATGAVALAGQDGGGSAAPTEPSTTVEASSTTTVEASSTSTSSSVKATTTTVDATSATVVVRVPVAPPDTSGDLAQRVTNVEKRVSTIESTIAEQSTQTTPRTSPTCDPPKVVGIVNGVPGVCYWP